MSSTDSILWTYLLTGVAIGFGHCIGMCGPLVISFSLRLKGRKATLPHVLYHCGRILTYSILGAAMGAGGSFVIVAASLRTIQVGAMFFAGTLVIVMGLSMGGWFPRLGFFNERFNATGRLAALFGRLSQGRSGWLYFPTGLVLGLLPCGPVYTALLGAARAGMQAPDIYRGLLTGGAMMSAFGLGTVPALFLIGKLAGSGWLRFRDSIYKAGAVLMIALGVYFIVSALYY
jgi:sulfite exporter TauE/SafE